MKGSLIGEKNRPKFSLTGPNTLPKTTPPFRVQRLTSPPKVDLASWCTGALASRHTPPEKDFGLTPAHRASARKAGLRGKPGLVMCGLARAVRAASEGVDGGNRRGEGKRHHLGVRGGALAGVFGKDQFWGVGNILQTELVRIQCKAGPFASRQN